MIKDQRHFKILDYLDKYQFADVEALTKLLKCSPITVRRDINELDEKGLLIKVHGGAQAVLNKLEKTDIDLIERSAKNIVEKERIAQLCAQLIQPGQSIYLDAGSSVNAVIPYLQNLGVKVYTHGVHHISELLKYKIESHLIGGDLKSSTLATVGSLSLGYVFRFHYDLAFLGTNAIDAEFGCSTPDEEEAAMKEQIILSSSKAYVLADHSKLNKKSRTSFAKLDAVTVVSDKKPPANYKLFKFIYPE